MLREPVAENVRVAGLYSSALARAPPVTVWPPAISTWPFFSSVAVKCSRGVVMGPTGTNESGPAPYPATAGPCGLSGALSDTAAVAVRSEVTTGANRTWTVHVPPGGRGAVPQLVRARKSPGFFPVTAVPLTTRFAEPTLVTLYDRAVLTVPTCCPPKAIAPGEMVTSGPGPARNSSALA